MNELEHLRLLGAGTPAPDELAVQRLRLGLRQHIAERSRPRRRQARPARLMWLGAPTAAGALAAAFVLLSAPTSTLRSIGRAPGSGAAPRHGAAPRSPARPRPRAVPRRQSGLPAPVEHAAPPSGGLASRPTSAPPAPASYSTPAPEAVTTSPDESAAGVPAAGSAPAASPAPERAPAKPRPPAQPVPPKPQPAHTDPVTGGVVAPDDGAPGAPTQPNEGGK